MKKVIALVFALVMVLTLSATAFAETQIPPKVNTPANKCPFEEGGGFTGKDANDVCPENNYEGNPEGTFGPPGSYYATGAIDIWQYEEAKRVTTFGTLLEVCFWDPGVGTVKYWTGSGWQTMPTYVEEGFRCTKTSTPGVYAIIAQDWETYTQ